MVLDIPPSIYNLENLTTLEICSTGISVIDDKISNMKNLENIHIYDNILDKIPGSILSLPKLKILNLEGNIFNPNYISAIKERINIFAQKGRKIDFMFDGQGHRQMVKRLRVIKDVDAMDIGVYARHCLNAVLENPYAIKYADKGKLHGSTYFANICIAAVRKTCLALENIDTDMLCKSSYFFICMEAAKNSEIGSAFHLIKDDLLSKNEYIQVCLEAALNNKSADFLMNFNNESFFARYSREVYERICWVAVLHYPRTITKMMQPTKEIQNLASKQDIE
jgi:hypothetical protein